MTPAKRVIVNTAAQYSRSVINTVLLLYSTRLVMQALGVSDYGVFALVGGVVAMLGFITNALVVTTQRFISYYYGKGDMATVRHYFSNSVYLHLLLGFLLLGLLLLVGLPVLGWLKIEAGRELAAWQVYQIASVMLFVTILTAPFKALFIARENIVYISVIEVIDGVMKLCMAIILLELSSGDKLQLYSLMILGVNLFNLLAFSLYAFVRFEECRLRCDFRDWDFGIMRELFGFAGWNTFGAGGQFIRNQGVAMVLNRQFGTVINAAYGIGFQVWAAVAFVATSILNAMNPQIIKAEGEQNRARMLHLAAMESKYSLALMLLVAVPLLLEFPQVLSLWLKEVPDHTAMFCRFVMVAFLFDQISLGLHTANQAMGRIGRYTLLTNIPKLLVVPAAWLVLFLGGSATDVMWLYLLVEAAVSFYRIPFSVKSLGLDGWHYLRIVLLPLLPATLLMFLGGWLCLFSMDFPLRFLVTSVVTLAIGLPSLWYFTLTADDRQFVLSFINRKLHHD
ncbi:MAG: hypothetical protein J5545_03735 [Bacteroidaceae bacterium]|nr:hypothetical protein [Bacteroidaceae bacterium]